MYAKWILFYAVAGWFVSVSIETALAIKHKTPMPKYGDPDWGERCFLFCLNAIWWPVMVVGAVFMGLFCIAQKICRNRPWMHPSWYLIHFPCWVIQKTITGKFK